MHVCSVGVAPGYECVCVCVCLGVCERFVGRGSDGGVVVQGPQKPMLGETARVGCAACAKGDAGTGSVCGEEKKRKEKTFVSLEIVTLLCAHTCPIFSICLYTCGGQVLTHATLREVVLQEEQVLKEDREQVDGAVLALR